MIQLKAMLYAFIRCHFCSVYARSHGLSNSFGLDDDRQKKSVKQTTAKSYIFSLKRLIFENEFINTKLGNQMTILEL